MARKKSGLVPLISDRTLLILAGITFVLVAVIALSPRISLVALAGRDLTPPVVTITSPTEGTIIGDGETRLLHFQVIATATDDHLSHYAYLYIDGELYQRMSGSAYTPFFDAFIYMPSFENGPHVFEVRVEDTRKNIGTASINVEFNNAPQTDFEGPSISITSPQDGIVYDKRGQYPVEFIVSDNTAVGRVETIYSQKSKKGDDWTDKIACIDYTGGSHGTCYFWTKNVGAEIRLTTRAYDWEGNMSEDSITATVK